MEKETHDNLQPVVFMSLGPGDPELLTLKAVRLLKEADVVVLPGTGDAAGHLHSRAASIVSPWCDASRQHVYALPMQRNRQEAMAVYDRMCTDICRHWQEGRRVVVGVEGDMSIYASLHYVMQRLQKQGVAVNQLPGITSFIAAAAQAGLSLASQQERLLVVPGRASADELWALLQSGHVVVVMKLKSCQQAVRQLLRREPSLSCHYFENVGTPEAYHSCHHADIMQREAPYFSLCVLRWG